MAKLTKAQIIEKLTSLGIQFDPAAKVDELLALLPNDTSDVSHETEAEPIVSVSVHDPKGNLHRTYSKAVHGDNFQDLANTYVSSRPGWTVK